MSPAPTVVDEFRALQRKKGQCLAWIGVPALVLTAALVLGLVPALNDALSGRPRYMEAFTTVMGRQIANALREAFPVLVAEGENADCRRVGDIGDSVEIDGGYFALTFSEARRSVCYTAYVVTGEDSGPAAVLLGPSMGRNYGRPITNPVWAIPTHRSLLVLSPEYVALMHWRAKIDPLPNLEAAAQKQRADSPSARFTAEANITVNLEEVRREVAKRHDLVNRILAGLAVLSGAVVGFSVLRLKRVYAESARLFGRYECELGLGAFLVGDLAVAGQESIALYQQKRDAVLANARLERSLEHEKSEASRRLHGLLESVQDDTQRERIERALGGQQLDEMQTLLQELEPHAAQPTPEERLHLLLETLKDYCSEGELREAESQVFAALRERGFRAAREMAVGFHEEFRARYREMADKETEAPQ